jgi:hypothetical protein
VPVDSRAISPPKKLRIPPAVTRARKARQVVVSDDENDREECNESSQLTALGDEVEEAEYDDDDEYLEKPEAKVGSESSKQKGGTRTQAQARTKSGKFAKGKAGGRKGEEKAKKEKEIKVKDERKHMPVPRQPEAGTGKRKSKGEDAEIPSPLGDATAPHTPEKEPTSPPKKRKLPTIKKNKPLRSTDELTQSAATKAPPTITKFNPTRGVSPIIPPVRKPPGNLPAELDLRNPALYAELFKTVSDINVTSS